VSYGDPDFELRRPRNRFGLKSARRRIARKVITRVILSPSGRLFKNQYSELARARFGIEEATW
jgi:hypothetical protein